jgi:uncharacterized repeat protein (TIGR02543 family)
MTKDGYTFGGWYKEAALVTPWNFGTDTVTGNITLYAKWDEDEDNPPNPGSEPSVYVVGSVSIHTGGNTYKTDSDACYWKNGIKTALPLSEDTYSSNITGIAVSGTTVYMVGEELRPGSHDAVGVWKSDNGGSTWTKSMLPENKSYRGAIDIAVSGSFVYVVGSDSEGACCWKSADAGATWTKTALPGRERDSSGSSILISGSAVYITGDTKTASTNRLACYWKSVDGGDTWSKRELSDGTGNASAEGMAVSGGNIYVIGNDYGTEKRARIWKSTDGGDTWSSDTLHDGAEDRTPSIYNIVLMESGVIYIIGNSSKGHLGQDSARACFWSSLDGGDTWARTDFVKTNKSASAVSIAAVNSTVHVIGSGTTLVTYTPCYWRSDDGGTSWTKTTLTDGENKPSYNDIALVWE